MNIFYAQWTLPKVEGVNSVQQRSVAWLRGGQYKSKKIIWRKKDDVAGCHIVRQDALQNR